MKKILTYLAAALLLAGRLIHRPTEEPEAEAGELPAVIGKASAKRSLLIIFAIIAIASGNLTLRTVLGIIVIVIISKRIVGRDGKPNASPDEKPKKALSRRLFVLSFLPFALILLYSAFTIFTGVEWGGLCSSHRYYGADAFFMALIVLTLVFSVIPVLPAAIIYQTIYISKNSRRRKERSV